MSLGSDFCKHIQMQLVSWGFCIYEVKRVAHVSKIKHILWFTELRL